MESAPPRPESNRTVRLLAAVLDVMALATLALALVVALVRQPPPRPVKAVPERVLVVAAEGFCWPILTPALLSGRTPALAGLAAKRRARIVLPPGGRPGTFWTAAALVRGAPPGSGAGSTGGLPLWEALARKGERLALVNWPVSSEGLGRERHETRLLPRSDQELPAVVPERPVARDLPPLMALRLSKDRRVVSLALRAHSVHVPGVLLVGFHGPFSPDGPPRADHLVSPPARYWELLDAEVARLLGGLPPRTAVVLVGRGLGPPGGPGADGLLALSGPGFSAGPVTDPLGVDELGPLVLRLVGRPLPLGLAALPPGSLFEPPWARSHPVRWESLP
ncbi:MAG: hypothetical protein HY815_01295 [Candidatus Riflebacteria bacterium]|nr:hypothetical protein [Candidatus Riflebacteria bacterium]